MVVVDVLMIRFKIYFQSKLRGFAKDQIYWATPLGERGDLYGNRNTWGRSKLVWGFSGNRIKSLVVSPLNLGCLLDMEVNILSGLELTCLKFSTVIDKSSFTRLEGQEDVQGEVKSE